MNNTLLFIETHLLGDIVDAPIRKCLDRVKANPEDWSARVSLGMTYFENGMLKEAGEELKKIAQIISDNKSVFKTLSKIYEEEGNNENARRSSMIFSALDSGYPEPGAMESSRITEEPTREESMCQRPFREEDEQISNDSVDISTNTIAEIYIKQGHPDKALKIYQEMLDVQPDNRAIQKKISDLLEEIGKPTSDEMETSPCLSKNERIIEVLNEWLDNLRRLKEERISISLGVSVQK